MQTRILYILLLLTALMLPSPAEAQTLRDDSREMLYSDFYGRAIRLQPLSERDSLSPYMAHLWMAEMVDSLQPSVLSDLGFLMGTVGEVERAQDYLLRAYRASGGEHLIGEPLARLALSNEDYPTAERVLTALLDKDPDDRFLILLLQQTYRAEEKWDEAIEMGRKIVELSNNDPRQVSALSGLYMQAGRQGEALRILEEYAASHPGEPSTQTVLFHLYLSADRFDQAEKALKQLRKSSSDPATLAVMEITLLAKREKYADAARYILRTAEREGSAPEQVEALIQTLYKEAKSATQARREMIRVRKRLTRIFPETPQMRLGLSQDYFLLGDSVPGERVLDRMVDDRVELVSPYVYFTDRYAAAEDTTRLRRYAEAGHEALPEEGVFRLYLALLSVNAGDTTSFRSQIDDALTEVSPDDKFYAQLALLKADDLSASGHFDEARPYYDAAVSQPLPPAYNNYAYFLSEKSDDPKDLDRAEELARMAIKLTPNNGTYLDTYAWILYRKGSSALALVYMKRAIDASEEPDPTLYEHLAEILTAEKRYDEAIEAWKKCLESGGDPKKVEENVLHITELKKETN